MTGRTPISGFSKVKVRLDALMTQERGRAPRPATGLPVAIFLRRVGLGAASDLRGQAIGVWAAASAITTALGPPLGGLLIDTLSWRAAFWINCPIACAVIWLTLSYMPESRNETETGELDWLGGLLAVLAACRT
jgi:predicted MFS family arabinose efflux permease